LPRDIDGPYGFGMKESLQDRLKSALKESPLNQTSLAKLVGITQPTISDQEVQVMLSKKKKTSHLLHLVLSLLTVGVWVLIWFIVALSNHMENAGIDRKIAAGKKIR
jgi:predicted XRE-type DNA-binding protein